MEWQWLIGPLMGSIIGYITNDITVRMMFRPHTEKRLFGRRVPFTPGLIPKEKPRLASAIREVLDQEILNEEVLREALLAESMLEKVADAAERAMEGVLLEERTPRALLTGTFGEAEFGAFEVAAKRAAGDFLVEKILLSGIEKVASEAVMAEVKKRMAGTAAALLTLFLDDRRMASIEEKLQAAIREMLAAQVPRVVGEMIESTANDGLDTPVGALLRRCGGRPFDMRAFATAQYVNLIRGGLTPALLSFDIGAIVEEKLNKLDMAETEALIMKVMKKELRAIVSLGALLGAIIGIVNTLLSVLLG